MYRTTRELKILYELIYTKKIHTVTKRTWKQIILYKTTILVSFLIIFGWYSFVSLIPTDKQVFSNNSSIEISELIKKDLINAAQYIDLITVAGDKLLSNVALYKNILTPAEQESLRQDWDVFLSVAVASEDITDVHRYFAQISLFNEPELHAQSFTISYALYMKKFEYFHKIISAVGTHNTVRVVLNEYSSAFGSSNSYTDVTNRYFATNSLLRRNIGYIYHIIINPSPKKVTDNEYAILLRVADKSYRYLTKNIFSHVTHRGITYTNQFNDRVSDSWLPIQKTVFVDTLGNIHVGDRTQKFITKDDIENMKQVLLPGDIFLARKNWYVSNVGIPGFWTHAGLYTGTIEQMESYFADIFPYEHKGVIYPTFTSLLAQAYVKSYQTFSQLDKHGYMPSIIESETKGTNIQSIEYSGAVDYFGVLRTSLSKRDILESLLRVFAHQGKPYDYEFDMHTKDEVFCSELVFDAYVPLENKMGLIFPTSVVTGREIVSPNDIIKKFVDEYGSEKQELSFVYFLDGSEITKTAKPASVENFIESYSRPKYSFLQQ